MYWRFGVLIKLISVQSELDDSLIAVNEQLERNPRRLLVDTETTGLDPYQSKLLLVQIATFESVFVYDFTQLPIECVKSFKTLLTDSSIIKVFQNASFDIKVFYHFGKFIVDPIHDTRVVEALLTAGRIGVRNDLASIASRRLGVELDKSVRDQFVDGSFSQITREQIEYAARDVIVLKDIFLQQIAQVKEQQLQAVYKLEAKLTKVVAMMEYYGMPFNPSHLQMLEPVFDTLINNAERMLQRMVIDAGVAEEIVFEKGGYSAVNTSSNQQMLQYFHAVEMDLENLNAQTVTEWDFKNRKSAKKHVIETDSFDTDLVSSIESYGRYDNYRLNSYAFLVGARKLQSTYVRGLQEMENPVTGRIHCTFNQIGAATGRFSSSRPNLQNLPSDQKMKDLGIKHSIRHAFAVKNESRRLIIADYSTIELVIIADASGDQGLINNLDDLHTYVAKHVLKVEDINKDNKKEHPYKVWREAAKMVNYSIAYSVGGENLAKQMTIKLAPVGAKYSPKQGDEIIEQWKAMFPEATNWLKKSSRSAVLNGWVADSYGRRRYWNREEFAAKWKKEAAEREAANFPIQALSATMVKLALIKTFERLDMRRAVIVSTVHDEVILESTAEYAEEAREILKRAMEESAREVLPNLGKTVEVDPAITNKYDK
jgi:DNA polymerase I-like protein with 3'-5' exonuclease and polymerase domains